MKANEKVFTEPTGKGDSLKNEHNFFFDAPEKDIDLTRPLLDTYEALRIVIAADTSIKENRIVSL